jgi:hypothetical protein
MKNLILNIFFLSISILGNAQISTNTNVLQAMELCGKKSDGTYTYPFVLPSGSPCDPSLNKLYYYGRYNTLGINEPLVALVSGASMNSVVRCFGPFISLDEGVQQISSSTATSLTPNININNVYNFNISTNSTTLNLFIYEVLYTPCTGFVQIGANNESIQVPCNQLNTCQDCIKRFQPTNPDDVVGKNEYAVSAWVKVIRTTNPIVPDTITSYAYPLGVSPFTALSPTLTIKCDIPLPAPLTVLTILTIKPSGPIIDGWQKMEGLFSFPNNSTLLPAIKIEMTAATGTKAYFDDIRFFPNDGSMMSYVYDPVTFRLVAELDERNYATMYEYDEEGKLVRVKKETEAGIMTIQENRENSFKRP